MIVDAGFDLVVVIVDWWAHLVVMKVGGEFYLVVMLADDALT